MSMLLLITMAALSVPPEAVRLFEEANMACQQGEYAQAIEGYGELLSTHGVISPTVYYNLANAHYRQRQLGSAILYYEAALTLDPHFEAARANLEKAIGETRRSLSPPDPRQVTSSFIGAHYPLSPRQSLFLAHACVILAIIMLLVRQWRAVPRYVWLGRAALCLAIIFYGFALASNNALRSAPKLAVAQTGEVPVYFSTNESEQPRFVLYEGDRVLVDRIQGDWVRLHAHGGERGWTKKDLLGIVDYRIW